MGNPAIGKCIACLLGLGVLSSCTGTPGGTGSAKTGDTQPVVENRVRIGEENWIVQPGQAGALAEAGTVESIEITNGTDADVTVPDAGINNTAFRVIFNGCTGILKPGEACIVRGEWTATKVREANLEVSVAAPGAATASPKKGISVPLGMAAGVAPEATLPPTTRSTAEPSPSTSTTPPPPTPSGTSGTATPPLPTPSTLKPLPGPAVGTPLKPLVPTVK
ncbi:MULTISPECIES: hypothetical protein [unclassified Arthrobacter]|uniref:hypothetical protein n=1 Tax=unclassified Arthrobacter TaxID=235627 RepID=UPI001C86188F|nr:hypothetical protein [Arthrobacter sp. MAHUQ-56]MBX7444946.1 hypothetical protein [Arthrobacter sp. MAHUQ-56]